MKFIIEVDEGGEMPRFYGLAWRCFYKPKVYGAPIPFHWFIGWGRYWWQKCKYPRYARLEEAELWDNLNAARVEIRELRWRVAREIMALRIDTSEHPKLILQKIAAVVKRGATKWTLK